MPAQDFVSPDSIRAQFSAAMSLMYKQEVPLYGTLLSLVSEINQQVMAEQPEVAQALRWTARLNASTRNATAPFASARLKSWQPSAACSR